MNWMLIILLLLVAAVAVWYFFFRTPTAPASTYVGGQTGPPTAPAVSNTATTNTSSARTRVTVNPLIAI